MAKKSKTKKATELSFEASLESLRQIVAELESGNLTLDESLEKYEEGMGDLKRCYLSLRQAEQKIRRLVSVDEEGSAQTEPFDGSATFDASEVGSEERAELQSELNDEQENGASRAVDDENSLF